MSTNSTYYIPHKATWPVVGTVGLMIMLAGFANFLNGSSIGQPMMIVGLLTFITMLVGWFSLQAKESESGMYNHEVGISYRHGPRFSKFCSYFLLIFRCSDYTTFSPNKKHSSRGGHA